VAEGTRLLSEYGVTSSIEGSNPSLSVAAPRGAAWFESGLQTGPVYSSQARAPAAGGCSSLTIAATTGGLPQLPAPGLPVALELHLANLGDQTTDLQLDLGR
jgi:hypothetical protein